MTARDVSDGVGYGEHAQTESERDAQQSNAHLWKIFRNDGTTSSAKVSQKVPMAAATHLRMSIAFPFEGAIR